MGGTVKSRVAGSPWGKTLVAAAAAAAVSVVGDGFCMARRGRVLRSECTRLRADLRASSAAQHLQRKLQVLFVQVPARSNAMQEVKRLEGAGERASLCRRAWTKKKAHGPAEPMRAARPGFNPRADLFAFCFYSPTARPSVVRFPPTATTNRLKGSLGVGFQRLAGWGVIRSLYGGH